MNRSLRERLVHARELVVSHVKDSPKRRRAKDASRVKDVKFETAVGEIEVPEMLLVLEIQVPEMLVPVSRASMLAVKRLAAMRAAIVMIGAVEETANHLVAMLEVARREVIVTRRVMQFERAAIAMPCEM